MLFSFNPQKFFEGLLNPLDCPHHPKVDEETPYREGVVIDKPAKAGSFVNVGLLKEVQIDKKITPGLRVTVEMLPVASGKSLVYTQYKSSLSIFWGKGKLHGKFWTAPPKLKGKLNSSCT